jgi:uncharacterized protein (TIGR02171 family)
MTALFLILSLFLLCSCSNSVSLEAYADISSETDSLTNMVTLHSTGIEAYVGTNSDEAKANERPKMKVKFDYDVTIAKHETTCSEFNSLMDLQIDCKNRDFPATNVTYYDAILYANARSKADKKDTAYTYNETTFDKDHHCINLNGLAFHPEAEAYRLPTEAEWMLAALQGWKPTKSWNADNSDYKIQEVCTSIANSAGICDMEGNVKEWVNDWLGLFRDTSVTDFLGAPDGGGVGERVVKGGSYRNESNSINSYSRGDIYLVTSSNKADYIGFRLAYGAIPNPSWIDREGELSESPITILANSATLKSLTGRSKSKLLFRNDVTGNLAIIDYSSTPALVREIKDTLDAYHPDISPDGNWVAFCAKIEGQSGTSSVYVRSIIHPEEPAIRLDVESAAIPRWRVLSNGDTTITYVTDAGNNQEESDFFSRSTWTVPFTGGKFGTPQKLFDGAYHGGISNDGGLSVTGSKLFRARITSGNSTPARDTVWYGGDQVCNVSLSKDGTNHTAFLDFGGNLGQEFTGKSYRPHEALLIADSTGKLVQSIPAPDRYTFDHTEWAGDGIIATLANNNGAHTHIVYINTADSSITELASGEELWHPCLWSKNKTFLTDKSILNLDSAGIYYREDAKISAYELRTKMELFWTQKDSITVVAFGSSRTLLGLMPSEMKSETMLNFGYSGGDFFGTDYLLHNYALNHIKNLKYIVIETTPNMFWRYPAQDWVDIYGTNTGFHYDESHNFWKDNIPDGFIDAVIDAPTLANTNTLPYREDFTMPSKKWGKAVMINDSTEMQYENDLMQGNFSVFEHVVGMANAAGVKVIALVFPVNPGYAETGTCGPYGPTKSVAKKIFDRISAMGVILMDENKWGLHDYTSEMAYDSDHLSYLGAKQLTHRLDSLLQTIK